MSHSATILSAPPLASKNSLLGLKLRQLISPACAFSTFWVGFVASRMSHMLSNCRNIFVHDAPQQSWLNARYKKSNKDVKLYIAMLKNHDSLRKINFNEYLLIYCPFIQRLVTCSRSFQVNSLYHLHTIHRSSGRDDARQHRQ